MPLEPGLHPVNGGRLRHCFPTATQDLDLWALERAYRLMPVYNDVPSRDLSVSGIHRFHQSIYEKSKPSLAGRSVATESTAWKDRATPESPFPFERSDFRSVATSVVVPLPSCLCFWWRSKEFAIRIGFLLP